MKYKIQSKKIEKNNLLKQVIKNIDGTICCFTIDDSNDNEICTHLLINGNIQDVRTRDAYYKRHKELTIRS